MSPVQNKPIVHGRDHLPHGPDPIPGLPDPVGENIDDIILGLGPDAFWKLNEASGNIAHDSSGNLNDLTCDTGSGFTPPTWGQAAGPPGTTTAHWGSSTTRVSSSVADPMTGFSNNFTAGIWVNVIGSAGNTGELLGQGTGGVHSGNGWALVAVAGTFAAMSGGSPAYANNPFSTGTWYFVACVRDAGTLKLYINGLLQTDTDTTSPGTVPGTNTWIGNDDFSSHITYLRDANLCYGFIIDDVLTSTELLAIYEGATPGASLAGGYVWTADGLGGASWEANLQTIAKDGSTALTGDVTLSEGTGVTLTQTGQDIEIASSGGSGIAASIIDAKGDLLVGSANDAVDNLTVGSNDQVLTADSGQTLGVKWATPSTGAAGAIVLLHTITNGSNAHIDQASISGSYNDLILVLICRSAETGTNDTPLLRFNNDSGANYYHERMPANQNNAVTAAESRGATSIVLGRAPAASGLANSFATAEITIHRYASTAQLKTVMWEMFELDGTGAGAMFLYEGGGLWNSTAAITRIQVNSGASAGLATGSVLRIYGRS